MRIDSCRWIVSCRWISSMQIDSCGRPSSSKWIDSCIRIISWLQKAQSRLNNWRIPREDVRSLGARSETHLSQKRRLGGGEQPQRCQLTANRERDLGLFISEEAPGEGERTYPTAHRHQARSGTNNSRRASSLQMDS